MTIVEDLAGRLEQLERRVIPDRVAAREQAERIAAARAESEAQFAAETPTRRKIAADWLAALDDLDAALRTAGEQLVKLYAFTSADRAAADRQERAVRTGALVELEVPGVLWPPLERETLASVRLQVAESRTLADRYTIPARAHGPKR